MTGTAKQANGYNVGYEPGLARRGSGSDTHHRLNASKMLSCRSSCTADARQKEEDV